MLREKHLNKEQLLRLLCCIGCGVVLLLAAFLIAYRSTLTQGLWFPTSGNSDEVIYNRQLAAILQDGQIHGYFGYNESHAQIGRFSTWGPFVIWLYALPGKLVGAGYNTVFWCNMVFAVMMWTVYTFRLNKKQWLVFAAELLCLWIPLRQIFTGTSEPLHFFLLAVVISGSQAQKHPRAGKAAALAACTLETIIRPYGVVLFLFPLVFGWKQGNKRNWALGICALAAVSTVFSLWVMNTLAAPFWEQSLDFSIFEKLGQGDIIGAVSYFLKKLMYAFAELKNDYVIPTLKGEAEDYIADVGHAFLRLAVMMAVVAVLCVYDVVKKKPTKGKMIGIACAMVVFLAIMVLYVPAQLYRYSAFICLILLMVSAEEAANVLCCIPLIVLILYPGNFARVNSLPIYNASMDMQISQMTNALTLSQDQLLEEDDPWQHTLSFSYGDVHFGYLYAVPAGMGIQFDLNVYIADPENTIRSRYVMVNHGTQTEARLLAEGRTVLLSTENEIIYERP